MFISYAVRKPVRLVLHDECGKSLYSKGWETPFGEEQHSSVPPMVDFRFSMYIPILSSVTSHTAIAAPEGSWSGFPRPVLLQLQGKRIGPQTAGNIL